MKDRFPFDHREFAGWETALLNVNTFWSHYRQRYAKLLASNVLVLDEELLAYQKEMGTRFGDA